MSPELPFVTRKVFHDVAEIRYGDIRVRPCEGGGRNIANLPVIPASEANVLSQCNIPVCLLHSPTSASPGRKSVDARFFRPLVRRGPIFTEYFKSSLPIEQV